MLFNLSGDSDRRIRALQALREPDESRDDVLRKFTRLTSQVLGIPGCFVSVLDDDAQYIRASCNFSLKYSSREDSLCRHVVDGETAMIVPDTWMDARFVTHHFVTGDPFIRFYAGVPLRNRENVILGTLCVTDSQPHPFSDMQIATLQLLAEIVMSFLEAWHSAGDTDPVTGLPNRHRLLRDLQTLATQGDTTPRRLVLIDCIDMPRAYELARSMGMGPVEELLKDVATLLPLRLRPGMGEMLYTVATGRFAILTPDHSRLSASWIAGRMEGISADMGEGLSVALTTHTGQADFTSGAFPAPEILRRALSAVNEAVGRGVPAVAFSETEDIRHTRDFTLMHEFAAALKTGEGLYLVYQPKICLKTGQPLGLEALIRWRHPLRGELPPSAFVPLVEQTELLHVMTEWVIDTTLARMVRLRNQPIQLPITVNVSLHDFAREGFAAALQEKMLAKKLPPSLLGIECLETERILESPAAMRGLEELKQRGFTISLDDFGAGYSNISYLRRMPLDIIKLDRSLIQGLCTDTSSRIIARSIVGMLKELEYVVLAEGVENAETARALNEFGCDQAQGYYYARPLADKDLDLWLLSKRGIGFAAGL
ncbi:EAL domain-containing protein [Candidatus Pantoea soli]|uniref:EAL domain-containing protein n=1 Tax=Candidatus Pantoea soli TaxID=3098669 RepID=A0A518XIG1_9GAMM|nr:EAL domain-containing protein [Pantoea soli]QDY43959.1 EAL domain-containing protein [Pantoea soli]